MEHKTTSAHVVPARECVQSGKVISGVKFSHAFGDYYRIIMNPYDSDLGLVLSSFKEVIRHGDDYLARLEPSNLVDGVAIVEHSDLDSGQYFSLKELLEDYLGGFNIYIEGSRYFPEILPERDFFKGLDFCAYLYAYIHSGTILYIEESHRYYMPHELWDSGMIGYIFANKRKFKNDENLFYSRIMEGLEEVNDFLNGNIYNVIESCGVYTATNNFVRNVLKKDKMIIRD